MKKKLFLVMSLFIISLTMIACGGVSTPADNSSSGSETSEKLEIEHQLGTTIVSKNPGRVVAFDLGIVDSLDKMGVKLAAIPKSNIPPYLSHLNNDEVFNAGSLHEPDFELLANINPDLIIISSRQVSHYDELSAIAPTIYLAIDNADYLGSFTENMRTLGLIFGQEKFIEDEIIKITQGLESIKEAAAEKGKALVVLANSGNISAYGVGSRFGILHDEMGFEPVDPNIEVSTHGANVSFEYIMEMNPDYLFVIDRGSVVTNAGGGPSAKETLENDLVKRTNAYKNGNIIYLDPNYWYISGGGLVSVAEMIKSIKEVIE